MNPETSVAKKKSAHLLAREKASEIMLRMVLKEIVPITESLISQAKDGNIIAIKELFDRAFGKSTQFMDLQSNGKELPQPLLFALFNQNSNLLQQSTPQKADYIVENEEKPKQVQKEEPIPVLIPTPEEEDMDF
jgi:hypothetical protein